MAQTLEHNGSVTQVVPVDIPLCDVDVEVIQKLDDEPNDVGGLSAQELKERFDHVGGELKAYINGKLVPTVVSNDLTEQARQAAESERVKNEVERVAGENARSTAETERAAAEEERISAEEERSTDEALRAQAEKSRDTAEADRELAEAQRVAAETARAGEETKRANAEAEREEGEAERTSAEQGRSGAEAERAEAEELRAAQEQSREAAEAERVLAEQQRVDTDNGIVAQAAAQAAEAGEKAAEAAASAQAAAGAKDGAAASADGAASSAAEAAAAKAEAETAAAGAENARTAAETAKAGAESAAAEAQEQVEAAEAAAAQSGQEADRAKAEADRSCTEADRAKAEADRAREIAGGDFVTPTELNQAIAPKANIPLVGPAELVEQLPAGGILLITEGEIGEGAKARQIAVTDKNGVLQVVELGGSGGKRVNGGDLLKEILIANVSTHVYRREAMLTWEDVEGLTPNTGIAPTEAEKEMFKAEDGTYTLKRIIYDSYISEKQATGNAGLVIKAIATDETSKVTVYKGPTGSGSGPFGKNTSNGQSQATHVMNEDVPFFFGKLIDGMDDMKVAVNTEPINYNAQQRVYIDVERADGSGVDYYVLVIHNARQYNNNVGLFDVWSGTGSIKEEGTDPAEYDYAIWIYPRGVDLSSSRPNAEVILWSDEVQEKIDAGDTSGLTQRQIDTVTTYGAVDEWGHAYPLAFRVKVPYCEELQIRMKTESPYSAIGFSGYAVHGGIMDVSNWTTAIISSPYNGFTPGQNIQMLGGVRTQEQNMVGINGGNREFTITVEFEVPTGIPFMIGSTAKLVLPSGVSSSSPDMITVSDGVDIQTITALKYSRIPLNVVLRNCNATYQITVAVGGKTYTGQIVTGPYFGQYELSEWTEVTEE